MAETKLTFKFNITTIILIAVIILISIIGYNIHNNKVGDLKDEIKSEIKLRNALTASLHHYRDSDSNLVAEKLTMQTDIENLESLNDNLTINQRELVSKIKNLDKDNVIISAALIASEIKIDSLLLNGTIVIDTTNAKIIFSDTYIKDKKMMRYGFTIRHVLPSTPDFKPTLTIDSLYFPNKQFVEFHWINDRKKGHPVSFTVTNSNEFFQIVSLDSYAIPNLNKDVIDPNFGKKISNFLKESRKNLIWSSVGVAIGATTVLLLTK